MDERQDFKVKVPPAYFAGVMLSLVPVLVLFIVFQNTIMEKVYFGGLKG